MLEDIKTISQAALTQIGNAGTLQELAEARTAYVGRKRGQLMKLLRRIPSLPLSERKEAGKSANAAKREIERALEKRERELRTMQESTKTFDPTEPGIVPAVGHLHVLSEEKREIGRILRNMGFWVTEGPHVESDWYNFQALNLPPEHPARDMWDTFWLKPQILAEKTADSRGKNQRKSASYRRGSALLLRTHGSPIQIHMMEQYNPPFQAVDIGRVFRHEATDASHEHTFDEIEGLYVDTRVHLADLQGFLTEFISQYFRTDVTTRLRPAYFPFVEPGAELIMQCIICQGKGCSVCKKTGWIELLGCGMIHPHVFRAVGYAAGKYSGFAFGMGVQRLVMMKYQIPDIRLFYQNDLRFLRQF